MDSMMYFLCLTYIVMFLILYAGWRVWHRMLMNAWKEIKKELK